MRHYGVSVEKVEEALKAIEYPNVKTVQIIFNIFRQRPAELFFEQAKKRKVGILARVPLASGMLTGKMKPNTKFESNDHRKYNRHGELFDRGETFSGVDYRSGLEAVEEIKRLVPHSDDANSICLALDSDVRCGDLCHSRSQNTGAGGREFWGCGFSGAFKEDNVRC